MKPVPPPPEPARELQSAQWAGLARRLRLAWAALLWERLWPLVLPPLCLAGLFVAFALFDLAPALPVWLHGLVLAATGGGIAFLLVRGALRLRLPDPEEAARRLERDSGLDHRPLAALADRPAVDDPVAHALWQAHLRRAAARLGALRLALPHPNMAARDPWGLRAGVLLLLVIAVTVAGADAPRRLARALSPAVAANGADAVEVWITPPAYTGVAPLLLKPGMVGPVAVPTGSAVLAVLSGGWGTARLALAGDSQPFQRQGDGSQRVEGRIDRSGRLAVRQALFTVAVWDVQAVADALPSAAFALPPEAGERGRLRLAVSASDDYGLAHVRVLIRRFGTGHGDEPPVVVELPLPGGHPRSAELAGWFDLTAHPWAGLPVTVQPVAEDGLGQTGTGTGEVINLPERVFVNPVAAAVVEHRRALTQDMANAPAAVDFLDRLATEPPLFGDDLKTFLLLRAARHALDSDSGYDLAEVQDLLWQAALRIEDGDLSSAERALDDARRALQQAVENGASAAEMRALLDRFQQALQRFTQALAEQAARQGRPPPLPQKDARVIGEDELRQMMDNMRDMAEAGARDALRQMLEQMGQILDGLQMGAGQQQANGPAQQGLRELRDLARKQQELLDGSHQRALEGEGSGGTAGGGGKGGGGAKAAEAQDALRRALAEAARKLGEGLGEAPEPLADADRAMAGASGQLRRDMWGDAEDSQADALAALQRAAREAVEQMGNSGQGVMGMVPRDPFGRPMHGAAATGDDRTTKVPDRAELQRSRQLLDEIRRRAGEAQRPEPERDYLKRLLRQF